MAKELSADHRGKTELVPLVSVVALRPALEDINTAVSVVALRPALADIDTALK
ncbi:MAG: hypothetical protein ACREE9_10535 [Stellaceae bacterium]